MEKKYDEIMNYLEVDDAMRERILVRIHQEAKRPFSLNRTTILRTLSAAACLVLIVMGTLTLTGRMKPEPTPEDTEILTGAYGIEDVTDLAALSERVGFDMPELTDLPFEVSSVTYTAYWQELAEITYQGENQTLCLRKSAGEEDNSGIYEEFETEENVEIEDVNVTLKGNNDACTVACWTQGGYAYSISVSESLSKEVIESLCTQIITLPKAK